MAWELCNKGKCNCLTIWDTKRDVPIIEVVSGEWGDSYPVIEIEGMPGGCLGELKIKAKTKMTAYGEIDIVAARATAKQIIREHEAHNALVEALEKIANPDNWFHTTNEDGGPYTAWRGEGEPDEIANKALELARTTPEPQSKDAENDAGK